VAHRGTNDDVTGISALWADIDLKSDAHQKDKLPETAADALKILPANCPPSIVIQSGNGLHCWWLFKEPWIFEDAEDRQRAAALAGRWQTMLRQNAAAIGWTFDRLGDLSRVLRIPGTLNHKDPAAPKQVVAAKADVDLRYNPSDLDEILDGLGVPDVDAAKHAAVEWAARFGDPPLKIDTSVQFPADIIEQFTRLDMRFRNTWLRQRHDLKDQSQSGYDMALAMFAVDASLTEQQIVDLLITHRNLHGQKHRTNPDYYQRTIAKAHDRMAPNAAPIPGLPGVTAPVNGCAPFQDGPTAAHGLPRSRPEDGAAATGPAVDPVRAKLILCEALSEILGIRILRILKITGKEPTYQIDLDNATVELCSVSKILEQGALRAAIAAQTERLMNRIKPKDWNAVAQKILDAVLVQEGGEEASLKGSTRMYLDNYLNDTAFIPEIDGQRPQEQRKPTVLRAYPARIAICASDLHTYLTKIHNQNLTVKAVTSMLTSIGAQCVRERGKFREQSRWILPGDDFDLSQYGQNSRQELGEVS
jgi:hypothetical protein